MSSFNIPPESKLTLELLDSVKLESWSQAWTWTNYTVLGVKDQQDAVRIKEFFGTASRYTFDDRLIVKEYCLWKVAQKSQVPTYMTLDAAAQEGHEVAYAAEKAIVASPTPKTVPACRVPMAEELLRKNAKGVVGVRAGSDILAASIASMTRWTGEEVALSMPIETMEKYKFVHAVPSGIRPFLLLIPRGTSKTGMKGRIWAHFLMAEFQKMAPKPYLETMSGWCRAMFSLPRAGQNVRLNKAFENNIDMLTYEGEFYYSLTYKQAGALAAFGNAYTVHEDYEKLAHQLVEFAAARQGDASGISMLSQSSASWGLVSKNQAEMEQTVSLILGMRQERTVLLGYTSPEMDRIRNSVAKFNTKQKIFQKVEAHEMADGTKQTSDVSNSLYLIRGRTMLDTTLVAQRVGKIKTFQESEALRKMWAHVESACSLGTHVIYFAAGLPPKQTKINAFLAGNSWASVFFFSLCPAITRALMTKDGLTFKEYQPLEATVLYGLVVKGMNNTVASWVAPPVNNAITFSALLAPMKVDKRQMISYSPDNDTYEVSYIPEEDEIVDPNGAEDGSNDPQSEEEGQTFEQLEKPKKKKEPPSDAYVPSVQSAEDM